MNWEFSIPKKVNAIKIPRSPLLVKSPLIYPGLRTKPIAVMIKPANIRRTATNQDAVIDVCEKISWAPAPEAPHRDAPQMARRIPLFDFVIQSPLFF